MIIWYFVCFCTFLTSLLMPCSFLNRIVVLGQRNNIFFKSYSRERETKDKHVRLEQDSWTNHIFIYVLKIPCWPCDTASLLLGFSLMLLHYDIIGLQTSCDTLSTAFLKSKRTQERSCWWHMHFSETWAWIHIFFITAPTSEPYLFLTNFLLSLWFPSVKDDLQHHLALKSWKADCPVVSVQLKGSFLGYRYG